jgi:hypothetical protein
MQVEFDTESLIDEELRKINISTFLFRVYSLLTLEITYTVCLVGIVTSNDQTRSEILANGGLLAGFIVATLAGFLMMFILKSTYPYNVLFLWWFVTCGGYILAVICSALHEKGDGQTVIGAGISLAIIFVAQTLVVLRLKHKFTFVRGTMYSFLWLSICWGGWSLLAGFHVGTVCAMIGIWFFCWYIVYDICRMLREKPLPDALEASVLLYLDIVILPAKFIKNLRKK